MIHSRRAALVAIVASLAAAAHVQAQAVWPSATVKIIVPAPPGGPTDTYARLIADYCTRSTGTAFVVENRPGANGAIALSAIAQAAPDGRTFLLGTNSTFVLAPILQKRDGKDVVGDLVPVGQVNSFPTVLMTRPDAPYKNLEELVSFAKKNPSAINAGSYGVGGVGHLVTEQLAQLAGVKFTHVNYPGAAAVLQAMVKGEIDVAFDGYLNARSLVEAGKLRVIASTGSRRDAHLPQVQTTAEAGFSQVDLQVWLAMMAPPKTPRSITEKFNEKIAEFLRQPETLTRLDQTMVQASPSTAQDLSTRIERERRVLGAVVQKANIKIE